MSVWRPGSDVLRINAAAGERAVAVSPDVREALRTARQISEWTGGKFDVTFGALSDVWKFDHDQDNTIPDAVSHPRAAPADRLPADRDRRSGRHRLPPAKGDAHPSRRHRQGLRGRTRGRDPPPGGAARFHDPGGRRSLRRRAEERPSVAARHRRPARPGGRSFATARPERRDVQHVRRLRALVHQGRRAVPPHPRSRHRPAGARLPQRDDRRRQPAPRRRSVDGRVHPRARAKGWR